MSTPFSSALKRTFRLEDGELGEVKSPQDANPNKKRIVDRFKCKECRRDKQKCLPQDREWPVQKCNRCKKRGFDCSANETTKGLKSKPDLEQAVPTHTENDELLASRIQLLLDQHYFLSLLKDATTRARDTMQEWTVLFALDQNNIATIEEWKSALEEIWANSAPWFARAVNSALKDCIAITSRRRNEIRLLSSLLHRPFTNIPQDGFRSFLTADTAKELFEACGEDDHATIDQTHQHLMSYNLENHESISFNLLARRARIVGRAFTGNELCPPVVQVFVQHQGLDFYLRVICISNKLEYASAMEVANFPSFPPRKRIPWFYGKVMFDQNPLHIAATLDIPAMLQHLLTTREYEPLQRACFSLRPIHFAAAKGHTKCLTVLSNHGRPTVGHLDLPTRSWTDQCQARDDMGRYPASYAAMHGHLEALKILTRDQSSKCTDNDWSGRTPISYAAENGHFETVKYLVDLLSSQGHKERLIVSHSDHKGRSPIGYARRNRHYDIVDYLEEIKGRIEVVTID